MGDLDAGFIIWVNISSSLIPMIYLWARKAKCAESNSRSYYMFCPDFGFIVVSMEEYKMDWEWILKWSENCRNQDFYEIFITLIYKKQPNEKLYKQYNNIFHDELEIKQPMEILK